MSTTMWIVFIVTFILGACAGIVIFNLRGDNKELHRQLGYYKRTYLIKQGGGPWELGHTDLRSFDGGKIWYAVKNTDDGVEILGLADDIYPGLLQEIEGFARLVAYAREHGPIGSRPITAEDVSVLTGAGFTVQKAK